MGGDEQKDFFNLVADEFKKRNNLTDLKSAILAKVEQITPLVIVSFADSKIMLTENDELYISEFFRLRCNIDKTGMLSSTVPSETDSAKSIQEVHSYGGASCQMPTAVEHIVNAILGIKTELLNLKCNLQVGDHVIIVSLEQKDRYLLVDKVLNEVQE